MNSALTSIPRFVGSLLIISSLLAVGPSPAAEIADSLNDWSANGTQGENGWFNGYYNLTQDADETYATDDFIEFLNDDSLAIEPDGLNHWDGNIFRLYRDTNDTGGNTGPWTRVAAESGHPNGLNSAEPFSVDGSEREEHWAIRRWVADVAEPTELTVQWQLRAQNTNGGGGTGGILFLNGVEIDSAVVGGTDAVGVERFVGATISPNDIIDLALTPENLDGTRGDGADGSFFRLTVDSDALPPPPPPAAEPVADSQADFSSVQGQDNWFYGYYDVRLDAESGDGFYSPDEFIEFLNDGSNVVSADPEFGAWRDTPNHWDGGKWDLLANAAPVQHGPWTQITGDGGHPAANAQGDEEIHWNIRRWQSEVNGTIKIEGTFSNTSANGDGTVGRILVDGDEVWSELSDGDSIAIDLEIPVALNSIVDFATDPDGSDIYDEASGDGLDQIADGNDGTQFFYTITSLTPPNALQAGDADMDLDFDQIDLVQVQIGGKYLSGTPATWGEGDWNGAPGGQPGSPPPGDSQFNQLDIITALNANVYLTGPYAAVQPNGSQGDGQTSIVYDPSTGEVSVDAPAGTELTSINIDSAGGVFTGDAAANLGGSFDNDADNNVFKATFGGSFGSLSFGNIAQSGLSQDFLLSDLTVVGSLQGGGDLGAVDLVYVPEPSTCVILSLGLFLLGIFKRSVTNDQGRRAEPVV